MSGNKFDPRESYHEINERVPIEDAARRYGLSIDRTGKKASCVFHNDSHPSMSFWNNRFRCFSCGASGSVLDLVMQILNLEIKGAAQRLNADYGLGLMLEQKRLTPEETAEAERIQEERKRGDAILKGFEIWARASINTLCKYHRELWVAKRDLAPATADEEFSLIFVLACQKLDYINYIIDALSCGTTSEKLKLFRERTVENLVDELRKKR